MNINDIKADLENQIEILSRVDMKKLPGLKAMVIMGKKFRKLGLPVKHLGKVNINVTESFFDDEILAEEVIDAYCNVLFEIKMALYEEFGVDSEQIFIDKMKEMSLTYDG